MLMTLARAADRTCRIGLGTAVAIPDYRHLMTTAAAVATLAGQAPGRVAVGLGPGRVQIMHGGKPGRWRDLDAYAVALRALLRGEQVEWNGTPHQLIHPDDVVAARPVEVPILLSAEGPTGLEIARRVAELRDRLQEMGKAGATEVIYQPAGPDIDRELTAFARMAGIGG